jgi:ABC-type uncharacterized transport system substrate-binding protein
MRLKTFFHHSNIPIVRMLCLLCALLFALSVHAQAQQPGQIIRIGYLDQSTSSGSAVLINSFMQELGTLGWAEGKNYIIESRFAEGTSERLPVLVRELLRLKVDLIVVSETTPALAAKRASTTIPIVFTNVGDPVSAGLVGNLAQPGGNVTGFASLSTQLNTKRLEILKDAVPKLVRVGLLHPVGSGAGGNLQVKELRLAAEALKLRLEVIETQLDAKGLENTFQTAKQNQVKAIMTITDNRFFAQRKPLIELAGKYSLPAIYPRKEFVDDGGLMSYGTDYDDLYRKAAHYVDKILKGAKPGDLPVQQPTKFEFVINLKAAKQIGLTIPVRVLERANQVVK